MSVQQIDLSQSVTTLNSPHPVQEINLALNKLRHETQEIAEELRLIQQSQQEFVIQSNECSKRQASLLEMSTNPEVTAKLQEQELLEQAAREKNADLSRLMIRTIDQLQRTFVELSELQTRILDVEVIRWKHGQRLAGNGVPFHNNLDQIQEWCESLADIIWQHLQHISKVENLSAQCRLDVPAETMSKVHILKSQIHRLISSLVTRTFIIEKQPPQVVKTNIRFNATVRLLIGSKLGVAMTPPQVKVMIVSEVQAVAIFRHGKFEATETSGDILNNLQIMEYHQASRNLSARFRNMKIRNIKTAEKKGTESVVDEKFSLLFQSHFKVRDSELVFEVRALSLPIVVIVHGNQEPHAWATVTWDNAFAEPGREPFQVPEKIPWKEMAGVLSSKFKAVTGRELARNDLHSLACKVFGSVKAHDDSLCLTWSQFCIELLPERSFTFWEWLYGIMEVTRSHLRNLWNDGLILGFVEGHQAEAMLLKRRNGTFLLEFSDSILGGITIAYVTDSQQRGRLDVHVLEPPFTSQHFEIRSLADMINDLEILHFLYPDVSKDQAFGKYCTAYTENQPPHRKGYVKWNFAPQITGYGCTYNSYPCIPQSIVQSPDSE